MCRNVIGLEPGSAHITSIISLCLLSKPTCLILLPDSQCRVSLTLPETSGQKVSVKRDAEPTQRELAPECSGSRSAMSCLFEAGMHARRYLKLKQKQLLRDGVAGGCGAALLAICIAASVTWTKAIASAVTAARSVGRSFRTAMRCQS